MSLVDFGFEGTKQIKEAEENEEENYEEELSVDEEELTPDEEAEEQEQELQKSANPEIRCVSSYFLEKGQAEKDKFGWGRLGELTKNSLKGYATYEIAGEITLINKRIRLSSSLNMPSSYLGSSYGGGRSEELTKENAIKIFEEIYNDKLEESKNKLINPEKIKNLNYEHHYGYYFFRLIPIKDFYVIISDKVIEMLKEVGFDFEEWHNKFNSIPENNSTDEDIEIVKNVFKLMKEGDSLKPQFNLLIDLFRDNKINSLVSYFGKSKNEIIKDIQELTNKFINLSNEINKLHLKLNYCVRNDYNEYSWEIREGKKFREML